MGVHRLFKKEKLEFQVLLLVSQNITVIVNSINSFELCCVHWHFVYCLFYTIAYTILLSDT